MSIGKRQWAIAEGFLPDPGPHADDPELRSHETACILNANERDVVLVITVFFRDRDTAGPYRIQIPARRTLHLRFDQLIDPEPIPRNTDYACVIEADQPVVIQHTRLDARPGERALITTMAYAEEK
ncbi:sensory rhodopsin transducer [Solimonas marina]|uniref:Sensory rhodopsin transducer n=1 Tax=Solimonas marina TaxID=2714601 RepID=A0A969WD85_9GAMM|nr:sensory rhodopsin transducer [Solimonas marina]NKF24404.1 sensory rhodopsin transducer [Solimonas marina]